ncbi:glycine betaine ABC transporter substrate-binding protein [Fimbriimonas ginsengisoli]|uniref:Substrate-binding region of ABC-type glycine betaine transport system n=1 Tax=Fimbriimonas ginsengisoli Gsoil 348 TaxID=661478 RepID=A0A068NNG9_FIMGI|nr:glycine betaine ABC transporter substrate-binding protein [Fimbriimonas ginsengisoli]AIE85088.1 Substrate-binding region of ABC-type glycine betaine transport system [Fimbriimonas ginsengisoli Gsoil 348]
MRESGPVRTAGLQTGFRICLAFLTLLAATLSPAQTITVGSKKFTESYVLGEIAKKVLTDAGFQVEHKQGMGATAIVWNALKGGSIQTYPEYTGTVGEELLGKPHLTVPEMKSELAKVGIGMTDELGFNNTYGLVMRRKDADALKIDKISDLKTHPELKCGITHELLGRKDGWKPLLAKYGEKFDDVKGIDHALGYAALYAGQIDLKDCYTTDAEIKRYDLKVLKDDLDFFPLYRAVFLYRLEMPAKAVAALQTLAGKIDEPKMIALNEEAGRSKDYAEAAATFFAKPGASAPVPAESSSVSSKIARLTGQHLLLVGVSLLIAVLVGIPLGIVASRPGPLGGFILGTVGVIQTIPSLALLALLVAIPTLGISFTTAVIALFLYSLLPIVRNTAAGLAGIAPPIRESAAALGLEPSAQLRKIFLPLAFPMILAGIKTSAVINVGTATLAALIGSGGLGEPIVSGLALNDSGTILQGAIPAAVLAVVVQLLFDLLEKALVPRGLRTQ